MTEEKFLVHRISLLILWLGAGMCASAFILSAIVDGLREGFMLILGVAIIIIALLLVLIQKYVRETVYEIKTCPRCGRRIGKKDNVCPYCMYVIKK